VSNLEVLQEVVGNGDKYQITIHNIPVQKLLIGGNFYQLKLSTNELNLIVKIKISEKNTFYLKRGRATAYCFSLKKEKDTYTLRIKLPVNKIIENRDKEKLPIKLFSTRGISASGTLIVDKNKVIEDSEKEKKRPKRSKRSKKVKNKIRVPMEKMERFKKIAEKMEVNQIMHKKRNLNEEEVSEEELKTKGIYYKGSNEKYSCDNCVYFIGRKCTLHNMETTKNHGCYRFRGYQILSGGSFTPK